MTKDRRLYAIVDVDTCVARHLDVLEFARRVCEAGPRCVQLRAKRANARETLSLLTGLVAIARPLEIPVYANDRPDLALLSGAAGVHVGKDDVPIEQVRVLAPALSVGLSTHDDADVRDAIQRRADYIAIGPIYPTPSKTDHEGDIGLSGLASAARLTRAAGIPLVAIGGIDQKRVREVAEYADWICVIGALVPPSSRLDDVTAHTRDFIAAIQG